MLKKIFIWWWVLILLLINLPYLLSFFNNYTWKQFFEQKKYELAKKEFNQANSIEWIYNIWNVLYKQWKYENSIKTYLSILWTWKNELNFKLNYNIANAYYKYWEKQTDVNLKKWYWLKAVDYYKKALKIKYDKQAKDNLEFVFNKLKNKKQNKQNQQSQKKNWQKKNKKEKQWGWEKKDNKNWQKKSLTKEWQKQWEDKKNQNKWWNWNKSKAQKKKWTQTSWTKQNKQQTEKEKQQAQMMKALKEYQKNLKKQQKQNMQNYGKIYQKPRIDDPFDDPFFTWMPKHNNVKDW